MVILKWNLKKLNGTGGYCHVTAHSSALICVTHRQTSSLACRAGPAGIYRLIFSYGK